MAGNSSPTSVLERVLALDWESPPLNKKAAEKALRKHRPWKSANISWFPDSISALRSAWFTGESPERKTMVAYQTTDMLARTTIHLRHPQERERQLVVFGDNDEGGFMRTVADLYMIAPAMSAIVHDDPLMAEIAEAGVWLIVSGDLSPVSGWGDQKDGTSRELFLVAQPRIFGENGRPHSDDGPAVIWQDSDGESLYYQDGLRVPAKLVENPLAITLNDIKNEQNVELRRALVEAYGYDRYFKNARAKLLQQDDYGKLWRVPSLADREPFLMVEVVNSTPEEDGSSRRYFLRVPPEMATAHEAVAWTFNRDAGDYDIAIES